MKTDNDSIFKINGHSFKIKEIEFFIDEREAIRPTREDGGFDVMLEAHSKSNHHITELDLNANSIEIEMKSKKIHLNDMRCTRCQTCEKDGNVFKMTFIHEPLASVSTEFLDGI